MRRMLYLFAVAVWLTSLADGLAVERFVPSGGALNYPTIQAAISACAAGDVVRVQPGVYPESIRFSSLDITLTSMDPGDSNVVQSTVIQGDGTQSVVTFASRQTTNTVFTGFTVRGGGGTVFSSVYLVGGGIYCYQSNPSIVGNVIEENHLSMDITNLYSLGGAISCWSASPMIARNVIRNNSAQLGGAIVSILGRPVIQDNWIYNNLAQEAGGAAYLSDRGMFLNNTLVANAPDHLYVDTTILVANNIMAHFTPATGVIAGTSSGNLSTWFRYNDVWEPGGTEIVLFSQVGSNTVTSPISAAGTNGNISADPLFVNATNFDLRLSAPSPCINAGDLLGLRSTNELDFAGDSRIFALRVDMGANEFHGARNYPPIANAGPDHTVYWNSGQTAMLDGSASVDPEGSPLNFAWRQTAGPPVALLVTNTQAFFAPAGLAEYRFELVVNDGVYDSSPDTVRVVVTNLPPIASAGLGQSLPVIPEVLVLDGSHSMDPEGRPLVYHWHQTDGPTNELTASESPHPVFRPAGPGVYEFELTVSDAFNSSQPDRVKFYLGQVPPVANAGLTRYAGLTQVILDGSASFAPNNSAPLEYAWRQVSGPALTINPTNAAKPAIRGFVRGSTLREAVFELVVSAGGLTSVPSTVKVVIVPTWVNQSLAQVNPPFNTNRPTIVRFSGGDCLTGYSSGFPDSWLTQANLFTSSYTRDSTSSTADPRFLGYGDLLITLLSAAAPDYDQPIQTAGFSTGAMPACDIAERLNTVYKDPRFLVNRITLLDAGCARDYDANISNLASNRMPGKMFWVDNYYSLSRFRAGTLNVEFAVPPAEHSTPGEWYSPSWTVGTPYNPTNFNNGVFAGAFFSVVGPGKNYQIETKESEYYFGWNKPRIPVFPLSNLVQMAASIYPARLPGVVELSGPTNGTLAAARRVIFSCQPVLNAVKYQILVGPEARRLDSVAWEGTTPPSQPMLKLPFPKTWWTIRVTDAYGTASWANPRHVLRDSDRDNLTDEAEVLISHTDPNNADTDGDGHLDGQELIAGTDPLQPNVGFQIGCRLISTNLLQLSWFSDPGNSYDLESSATLEAPSWQRIQTFVAPVAGGLIQHTIPIPADPTGFFRVRSYAVPGN